MPAFTPEAIQLIRKAVKSVLSDEVGTRGITPRGPRRLASWIGKVTVEVTARSGTTPGTGTVKLQTAPVGGSLSDHAGTASTTMTVTVHSLLTETVAVDSYAIIYQDQITGRYWIVQAATDTAPDQIQVRNDTGSQVDAYGVIAVTDPVNTIAGTDLATYQSSPLIMKGVAPATTAHWGKWAVYQQDTANGATGAAIISGMTTIRLFNKTTLGHKHVDIRNSSHLGEELHYGKASVLDVEISAGSKYGWVNLGNWDSPILRATVNEVSGIAANGSGDCDILDMASETVTVHNNWMENAHAFNDDDELLIRFNRHASTSGQWQIVSGECGT